MNPAICITQRAPTFIHPADLTRLVEQGEQPFLAVPTTTTQLAHCTHTHTHSHTHTFTTSVRCTPPSPAARKFQLRFLPMVVNPFVLLMATAHKLNTYYEELLLVFCTMASYGLMASSLCSTCSG